MVVLSLVDIASWIGLTTTNNLYENGDLKFYQFASYQDIPSNEKPNLSFPPAPPPPTVDSQISTIFKSPGNFYDAETWVLYTTVLRNNSFAVQPYSANGYIGTKIPVQGQGFAIDQNLTDPKGILPSNGWPLLNERFTGSYLSGFWDYQTKINATNFSQLLQAGGESVISTLPVWSTLEVTDTETQQTFDATVMAGISNYCQSLSLKNGIVQTNLTWTPSSTTPTTANFTNTSYSLNYTVLTHRTRANLGIVRLDITASSDTMVEINDILDGAGSFRTQYKDSNIDLSSYTMWTSVQPIGIKNVTAYEYSKLWFSEPSLVKRSKTSATRQIRSEKQSQRTQNPGYTPCITSTVSQTLEISLKEHQTITVIKYVGIASTDAFPDDTFTVAMDSAERASMIGWNNLVQEHNQAWNSIWSNGGEIVIPKDEELQIAARASLFHLIANIRDGSEGHGLGDNSIAVSGLSSDSYAGLIFWDADTWMSPALQALFPNFASSITNYRSWLLKAAIRNTYSDPASVEQDIYKISGNSIGATSAVYPWTSSRFGNCTSAGPCFDYVSRMIMILYAIITVND